MRKIANVAAYLFILSVVILSAVSILGVWDFFSTDVITKSFESIGLLAAVAVIVLVADHFIDQRPTTATQGVDQALSITPPSSVFKGIRMITLTTLILSVVLLALLGIMAIWEVLSGDVLHKSIASISIIAFSSLVIVVTCLEREDNPILHKKQISGGAIALIIVLSIFFVPFLLSTLF
jgi:hypothetical protein